MATIEDWHSSSGKVCKGKEKDHTSTRRTRKQRKNKTWIIPSDIHNTACLHTPNTNCAMRSSSSRSSSDTLCNDRIHALALSTTNPHALLSAFGSLVSKNRTARAVAHKRFLASASSPGLMKDSIVVARVDSRSCRGTPSCVASSDPRAKDPSKVCRSIRALAVAESGCRCCCWSLARVLVGREPRGWGELRGGIGYVSSVRRRRLDLLLGRLHYGRVGVYIYIF